MAYDGWFEYNGVEIVNHARTVALARALSIGTVVVQPASVDWIQSDLMGFGFGLGPFGLGGFGGPDPDADYGDITQAPWYDAGYEASAEFAGFICLSMAGLDDSTRTAATIEYITDGGTSGVPRNTTLVLVGSFGLIAKSERGAEYGKRWLDRVLRNSDGRLSCSGANLDYYRYGGFGAPRVHRRDVRLTRGASVTRKKNGACSATWLLTFTLTAGDPYEYGEALTTITALGGPSASGPGVVDDGNLSMAQASCPVYDYTPIYDPLYPALVPSPTAPDFYPAGWNIADGMDFTRYWARIGPAEPSLLNVVPLLKLTTDTEARMVRVSVWPSDSATSDQCDPLFSVVVSYLPADLPLYVDGEQEASYVWDGVSPAVRRADSLVYAPDAKPVQWNAFNDPEGLLVTLDIFTESDFVEGDGDVRVALGLIPKSD